VTRAPRSLVHGARHGAWCWDPVRPLLEQAGHAAHTPTLPGQGERAAELSPAIDLESHIADIVTYIGSRDLRNVVLVGHSYGGIVVSGVADRIATRLKSWCTWTRWCWAAGEASPP
jgi:pimeloyl-ACP methyl ester carboxylesterase